MKKLMNKKGFTLMEMLIVIAIIVILVAVAVPSFTSALDKANKSADDANFRTAESLAAVKAIEIVEANTATDSQLFYLDLGSNELKSFTSYQAVPSASLGKSDAYQGAYILVTITKGGEATVQWTNASGNKVN